MFDFLNRKRNKKLEAIKRVAFAYFEAEAKINRLAGIVDLFPACKWENFKNELIKNKLVDKKYKEIFGVQ